MAGGSGFRVIREREPALFDLAAVRNGYHADQSRTFAVGGLPGTLDGACGVSLGIAKALVETLRAGVVVVEDARVLRAKGWEKLTSSGYEPEVEGS